MQVVAVFVFEYVPTGQTVHSFPLIYFPLSHETHTPVLKLHLDSVDETVLHVNEHVVQLVDAVTVVYVFIAHCEHDILPAELE